MAETFYERLNLQREATTTDIRKAYVREAKRCHPDRLSSDDEKERASKRFQALGEAYNVLSDPGKKAIYDHFGNGRLAEGCVVTSQTISFGACSPGRLFDDFLCQFSATVSAVAQEHHAFSFATHTPTCTSTPPSPQPSPGGGVAVERPLELTLEELYAGVRKRLKLARPGGDVGQVQVLEIPVQRGTRPGTRVTFRGAGALRPDGQRSDIVFVVHEKPHGVYQREGSDLHCTVAISLKEALTGFTRDLALLCGSTHTLVGCGITQPGHAVVLRGRGMPTGPEGSSYGDVYVTYNVVFPASLSADQVLGLRALLP